MPAGPCQLLGGGEGELQEAESFQLAGVGQRTGVDGAQPARATMSASTDFASASSPATGTVVGGSPTVPEATVAAKFVLNAFRTRDWGSEDAISEASGGTTTESNVSKFSGFLAMPTTTLPTSWSPRCASTAATAG